METIRIIETRKDSVLLQFENGETLLSARYKDDPAGDYVLDSRLEKQYIKDLETVKPFTFKTDLYDDTSDQIWMSEERTFLATDRDDALRLHSLHYQGPLDRELINK